MFLQVHVVWVLLCLANVVMNKMVFEWYFDGIIQVIVVSWAQVICLICTPKLEGCQAREHGYTYQAKHKGPICTMPRQAKSLWVINHPNHYETNHMNRQVLTGSRKSSIKQFYKYFKATALFYRLFTTFTKHLYG